MKESKNKVCKYPKCQKSIPGEKGIFCSYHKKLVKEKGGTVGKSVLAIGVTAVSSILITKGTKD
ncbi:hypothetical protein P7H55_08690 [Vagococcus lutrae]|uniref:hypothetical protein n=1 Tax=Vagococcus lutrae TaxID=81947 RepID=UPI00288EB01D|nr:hypothetical protein [Vagococcus lutrae]MDT2817915.1 hypothetical protein [Vagococcus lutrae]